MTPTMLRTIGFFGLVLFGWAVVALPTGAAPDVEETRFDPDFRGYPLAYFRAMETDHPFPVVSDGILLTRVNPDGPLSREGVVSGSIMVAVDGVEVRSHEQAVELLNDRRGEEVVLTVFVQTPQFRRAEDRPIVESRRMVQPYQRREVSVQYTVPEPEPLTVYVRHNGELYHRPGFRHSPSGDDSDTFAYRHEAEEHGHRPCPICFPGGDREGLMAIFEEEVIGPGEHQDETDVLVERLREQYEQIVELPPELIEIRDQLRRVRLRRDVIPRVMKLDSSEVFGFGLPGGTLLFSRGYWNLAEGRDERMALLGHLMAHTDLIQEHSPEDEARFRGLLIRALEETTGRTVSFGQLRDYAGRLPGFSYYRGLLEEGYTREDERRALFFTMTYLYKTGHDPAAVEAVVDKKKDMEATVYPAWVEYLIQHPLPERLSDDLERWRQSIPDHLSEYRLTTAEADVSDESRIDTVLSVTGEGSP